MVRSLRTASVFLLFSVIGGATAGGQLLPAIDCSADESSVIVSWECAFDNVQRIVVRRSLDRSTGFVDIGLVENLTRGMQHYRDKEAATGTNYYKLSVVFSSGVKWSSNGCQVNFNGSRSEGAAADASERKLRDAVSSRPVETHPVLRLQRQLYRPDVDFDPQHWIQATYVTVHPGHGHVIVTLPSNWRKTRYSISFFDSQGNNMVEMPYLSDRQCVLDKRNFRQKARFTYILKRNGFVFETAFVDVDPGRLQ